VTKPARQFDVAIIGAGPVGLFPALQLADRVSGWPPVTRLQQVRDLGLNGVGSASSQRYDSPSTDKTGQSLFGKCPLYARLPDIPPTIEVRPSIDHALNEGRWAEGSIRAERWLRRHHEKCEQYLSATVGGRRPG
jgi:glycine/D-amino acid oxidase-like deaminating enzyme